MNQKIYKVNISEDANTKIESMLTTLTNDNSSIKINKQKLISWIILQFENKYFQKYKEQIQKKHFDQLEHIQNTIKKLKQSQSHTSEELKSFLKTMVKDISLKNEKLEIPEVKCYENAT